MKSILFWEKKLCWEETNINPSPVHSTTTSFAVKNVLEQWCLRVNRLYTFTSPQNHPHYLTINLSSPAIKCSTDETTIKFLLGTIWHVESTLFIPGTMMRDYQFNPRKAHCRLILNGEQGFPTVNSWSSFIYNPSMGLSGVLNSFMRSASPTRVTVTLAREAHARIVYEAASAVHCRKTLLPIENQCTVGFSLIEMVFSHNGKYCT